MASFIKKRIKKQAQKAKKALKTAVFKQKTPFFTKKVRR